MFLAGLLNDSNCRYIQVTVIRGSKKPLCLSLCSKRRRSRHVICTHHYRRCLLGGYTTKVRHRTFLQLQPQTEGHSLPLYCHPLCVCVVLKVRNVVPLFWLMRNGRLWRSFFWKQKTKIYFFLMSLHTTNYICTVLKFQDFSVTQILREINFGESRSPKIAILPFLGL